MKIFPDFQTFIGNIPRGLCNNFLLRTIVRLKGLADSGIQTRQGLLEEVLQRDCREHSLQFC